MGSQYGFVPGEVKDAGKVDGSVATNEVFDLTKEEVEIFVKQPDGTYKQVFPEPRD